MASRAKKKKVWRENKKIRQRFEDTCIKTVAQDMTGTASLYHPPRVD